MPQTTPTNAHKGQPPVTAAAECGNGDDDARWSPSHVSRNAPRLTARLARWRRFFCWPRACSLSSSSSSSSSQSPSARGRRRTPASVPKPHSCGAFCRGADKPPPLMLHLRLIWFRVSFSRGGADDGAPLPLPAAGSCSLDHLTTSLLLLAWTGPLLLGWQGAGVPRDIV